ncbi:hypothetical protein JYT26_00090 [Beggiatoa alba]|nr:hypothetical protein [Beggiatoa alba]
MKNIEKFIASFLLPACLLGIGACTNNDEPAKTNDHFLKEKLDTIKKAEAVEQLIQDATAKQRRMIDEQTQGHL